MLKEHETVDISTDDLDDDARERLAALRQRVLDVHKHSAEGGREEIVALNQIYGPLLLALATQVEVLQMRVACAEMVLGIGSGDAVRDA